MPGVQNDLALDRIRKIVAAVLEIDTEEVEADAHFYDDLSADSLEKVEIVVRLEREFGLPISSDEAACVNSAAAALALLRARGVVA